MLVYRSEDNLRILVLSYSVGPSASTQVIKRGGKHLYSRAQTFVSHKLPGDVTKIASSQEFLLILNMLLTSWSHFLGLGLGVLWYGG